MDAAALYAGPYGAGSDTLPAYSHPRIIRSQRRFRDALNAAAGTQQTTLSVVRAHTMRFRHRVPAGGRTIVLLLL